MIGTRLHLMRIIFTILVLITPAAWSQNEVSYKFKSPDLDVFEFSMAESGLFSPRLIVARTALKKYRIGVLRANEYNLKGSNVKSLALASKATLAVNANFFDENGQALGLILSHGSVLSPLHKSGNTLTGIFQIQRNKISIVNREAFKAESVLEAIQAGPRLLDNSAPIRGLKDSDTKSRRVGLCIDKSQNLLVYADITSVVGISLNEVQQLLMTPELACQSALNLDGGGSAQLYIGSLRSTKGSSGQEIYIEGQNEVPVALALFANESEL